MVPKVKRTPGSAPASPAKTALPAAATAFGRRGEVCAVCGKPVFILERLNVAGKLLHRSETSTE